MTPPKITETGNQAIGIPGICKIQPIATDLSFQLREWQLRAESECVLLPVSRSLHRPELAADFSLNAAIVVEGGSDPLETYHRYRVDLLG